MVSKYGTKVESGVDHERYCRQQQQGGCLGLNKKIQKYSFPRERERERERQRETETEIK